MRTFFAITCSSTLPCDVLTVPVHLSEGHQREIESITKCHPSTHQLLESKKQLSESKNVRKRKQKAQEAKAPSRACGQETEAPTNSHKGTLTVLSSQEVSSNWAPPPTNEQLCPSPRGGLRGPQHNFKSVVSWPGLSSAESGSCAKCKRLRLLCVPPQKSRGSCTNRQPCILDEYCSRCGKLAKHDPNLGNADSMCLACKPAEAVFVVPYC